MGMSIAVCVATPFQALNAINLVCNSLTKNDRKVLFYRDYSAESHSILLGIKNTIYLIAFTNMIWREKIIYLNIL